MQSSLICASLVAVAGCQFHVDSVSSPPLGLVDLAATAPDDLASAAPDLLGRAHAHDLGMSRDMATRPDLKPPVTDMAVAFLVGAKVTCPATIDLTTEGTRDWIQLGLARASDVNRKASGGSLITVAATTTLNEYTTYATTFSWTDGAPTASSMGTTNGVYTLGVNQGFSLSVPADTTPRTLKLYLNVGGTASLTAHLSDSSAANYTASATGPNDGTMAEFDLRYAAASAGQMLSISWTLTSGTGNSFVAAALE